MLDSSASCEADIIQCFAGHYQMCGANIQNWNNNYIKCESNGDKKKKLSLEEYLDLIKPLLQDIVNILKEKSDAWKIQLTIAINFMSSIDQSVMHSKSDNWDIMINAKEDKLTEEHFQSFFFKLGWIGNINRRYWPHIWLSSFIVLEMS